MSFGGSNTFSLAANSTEFAGLYWDAQNGEFRMPVGYNYNNGSAFIRYSGANSPLVGTPISGGASGTFTRTYDFSITVDSVTQSVPEPLTILGAGAAISFGTAFKRKLAQKKDKAA
ncbi:hypothetical protein AsFPU3_2549 [Aphanothece sacrum FPU3]|nr:hypothetical protein AsFPU3_2549 [Aphanothece sacrum FPU3]